MSSPKTLIAWLSVQDCRSIKDYPATQGGVVLSALNSSGATRLLLLSHLQSRFTNDYLEKLSEVWPGDIAVRLVEDGGSAGMSTLWPWACAQLKAELDAHPDVSHDLLLASSLPSCQAIFLTHGLTDERCNLLEPLKNGDFQALTLPRIQLERAAASPVEKTESAQESNAGGSLAHAAEEVDFYDLGFDETPAQVRNADAVEPVAESDAGPGLLAVLVSVEETCEEVATEDEFGVSNAGPVVWFDETSEAEETAAAQAAEALSMANAEKATSETETETETAFEAESGAVLESGSDITFEAEPELETAHEWAVEEVALKPAEEIDFSVSEEGAPPDALDAVAEAEAEAEFGSPVETALEFEPELESAQEWAVEEVALKPAEEIDFSDVEADPASEALEAIASFEETAPAESLELSFDDEFASASEGSSPAEAFAEPTPETTPDAFDAFEATPDLTIEDELSKAAAALDDPFDDFASAGSEPTEPAEPVETPSLASGLELDFPELSPLNEAAEGLEAALAQAEISADAQQEPEPEPEPEPVAERAPGPAAPWPYASAALQQLSRRADALAGGDLPVLVLGEAGSGTRLLAKRIHELGRRADAPLIVADLTAIHSDAIAQELWGEDASVRGERRAGFVELAQGGSLLIAGLELMPAAVQTQLLSLMTRGDYLQVGAENPTPANVRMLATASDELLAHTKAGRFNRKLFDLFGKGLLTIPALRNRKEDLPALLGAMWPFIQGEASHQRSLSADAHDWLLFHGFSGTVKDLELALRRTCLWAQGDEVDVDTLRESVALSTIPQAVVNCSQALADGFSLKDVVFSVTKHFIHQALTQSQFDLDKAAALLGVSDRDALAGWMKRVGIDMPNENNFEDTLAEHREFESVSVSVSAESGVPVAQPERHSPDLEISLS